MKPWLFLPSSLIHFLSPCFLKVYSRIKDSEPQKWASFHWRHLYFSNPLGIAGGVDKNATLIKEWWRLGAGFLEIGTCTPKPQRANPGKILDRSFEISFSVEQYGIPQ